MTELSKAYEPHSVEEKWYQTWNSRGYFKPQGNGPIYCITIPPPNVTGSLHIGHALCYSIQAESGGGRMNIQDRRGIVSARTPQPLAGKIMQVVVAWA